MAKKDVPNIILECTTYYREFEEYGKQLATIAEKISNETGVIVGMCPPYPFLVKYSDRFDIPLFSRFFHTTKNQKIFYRDSIEFYKTLGTDGLIINDDTIPIVDLEREIRDSRTHRLYTLVYSSNVAISAAISKFDPNGIIFHNPQEPFNKMSLSKLPSEMIENHIKRIKMENPKVSAFSGVGIYGKGDIEKGVELKVDGFLFEIPYTSKKDPAEFLTGIIRPLKRK
jgi:triosephosphate isomerase